MKFLIDANLPVSFCVLLKAGGHDVLDARQISPTPAQDDSIYQRACDQQRTIITRDLDFANITAFDARRTGGIIILRTHLLSMPEIQNVLQAVLDTLSESDIAGRLIIAEPHRIRMHTPPL